MTWKTCWKIQPILIALVTLVVSGCDDGRPKTVSATGTVMVDGKPVAGLVVMFVPKDEKVGRAASGRTDESGAFQLTTNRMNDGAVTGDYKVLVKDINDNSAAAANATVPKPNDPNYKDLQRSFQKGGATAQGGRVATEFGDVAKTTLNATVTPSADKNKFKFEVSAKVGG